MMRTACPPHVEVLLPHRDDFPLPLKLIMRRGGGWTARPRAPMLGDVTSRPHTGQPLGVQSGDSARPRPTPVPLSGDPPTERHRLPARVTRYWRWRAFCASLPLLVLLVSRGDRSAMGPLVGSLGRRRHRHRGDRRMHDHPAADPVPCLLVRDLVDGDRHPERDHFRQAQPRADAARADPAIRTRADGRPLPDDDPEDPYCGRLGQPQRTGPGRS